MMDQLTLLEVEAQSTLMEVVSRLVREWTSRLGDGAHAVAAGQVTSWRFAALGARSLEIRETDRVEAYYRAVLRRRILSNKDASATRARRQLVAASIRADLEAAGWDAFRAAAEARRATGAVGESLGAA